MELIEGLETRRSVRAYKSDPLPEKLLRQILETAKWSPSFADSQPWEVAVVTGKKLEELKDALGKEVESGTPADPDLPVPQQWPPEIAARLKAHYEHHQRSLGKDPSAPRQARPGRPDFYNAPCAVFLFVDKGTTEWSIYDAGLFSQTLILAAHAHGVGSCLQAMMTLYPGAVRKCLGIPDSKKLVVGISLGYPDTESEEYGYRSEREGLDRFVKWC
jgi:nitroreductase